VAKICSGGNKFTAYLSLLYKIINMPQQAQHISSFARVGEWLRLEIEAGPDSVPSTRGGRPWLTGALMCVTIFSLAIRVRMLHWQDNNVQITRSTTSLMGVFNRYRKETDRILAEGSIVFPREQPAPGDARMLAHPPGYSILMAGIKWASSRVYEGLWLIQILADGLSAILIFLLGSKLFRRRIGFIAGMLVAISPQLAYYCLLLTPDSLAVLPVLASMYLLVLAVKRPRPSLLIGAGALIGLSCWLGANAMGLVFFLALLVPVLFEPGKRIRYATALVGAALIVIAPITLRNWIAYHRVIPISIQAGLSLAEGIGDYDQEGKLGMPRSDQEARVKDAEWSGRPEYTSSLWFPDGIERDRVRLSRGLAVVRSRPVWFLGVMFRRVAFMLRYNDSGSYGWPQDSSVVGLVQPEPPFSQGLVYEPRQNAGPGTSRVLLYNGQVLDEAAAIPPGSMTAWSISPSDLLASGRLLASGARATVEEDRKTLVIVGDESNYDNQFASEPINVAPNTDYILVTRTAPLRTRMAIKVLSADMRIALSSASVAEAVTAAQTTKASKALAGDDATDRPAIELREVEIQMPFSSGPRSRLFVALSNNGQSLSPPPTLAIREFSLIALGPTGGRISRLPRLLIRVLQKALFTTSHMIPLLFIGVVLCALAQRFHTLLLISAVPFYYLAAQSVLHTEYRYVLGIHYFAFIAVAIALDCGFAFCNDLARWFTSALRLRRHEKRQDEALPQERVRD